MTTAEQIATQFGNDGQSWTDNAGADLSAVCLDQATTWSRGVSRYDDEAQTSSYVEVSRGEQVFDATRYVFADGSAIVTTDGGWDVEGATPFSWAGA